MSRLLEIAVSLAVLTLMFALFFKYVPDAEIRWRDVWLGGLVTAVLFTLGKTAIGYYLGQASVGSAYGAAGSMIVLLVWVYYSALIVFFGAEFTQAWATRHGGVAPATRWPGQRPRPRARQPPSVAARDETPVLRKSRTRRRLSSARRDTPRKGARPMAEPTAQRAGHVYRDTR